MKIMILHNRYKERGGEDVVVEYESDLLKSKGHEIKIITFDNAIIGNLFQKIKTASGAIFNIMSFKKVLTELFNFSPDIVHVHNFFPVMSPAVFYAAAILKVPVVMTLHNYRLLCLNALFFRKGKRCMDCVNKTYPQKGILLKCYRNSYSDSLLSGITILLHRLLNTWHSKIHKYIVLSEFSKEIYLKSALKIPESRFIVKRNFAMSKKNEISKEQGHYLFVGRFSEEKGLTTVLKAFSNSRLKLRIIGTGPLDSLVAKYCQNNANIANVGPRSKQMVLEELSMAKALIFPSVCFENCPMIILESFSVGTPVIASNIGGGAELVIDGVNGLHYRVGDTNSLSEKISLLEHSAKLTKELGENAEEIFRLKYSAEKNYDELLNIYKMAIDENGNK